MQNVLKKSDELRFSLADSQMHYKTTILRVIWRWCQHRHIRWNQVENPKAALCIFKNVVYDKDGILNLWRKDKLFN